MMRMRFPSVWVSGVALIGAMLGAPAMEAQPASVPVAGSARVDDIQVAHENDTISILIKLSQQPAAAVATASGEVLTVEIDGVSLAPLTLTPQAGSLVRKVEAGSGKLTLSGAAFGNATTVIYRNAVLVEAKLAEPKFHAGTSLMATATPGGIPIAAAPAPVVPPLVSTPIRATVPPKPAEASDTLQSHPAPAAPAAKSQAVAAITSMAGIDPARCDAAAAELANDAWALGAMGDHALCLLDADRVDEAKSRIDQLAAITPQDWRVALGRAVLEEKAGDAEQAQASFVAASLAAPNDAVRAAIASRISPAANVSDDDLQLPLPKAVASSAH